MSAPGEWLELKVARHWREALDVAGIELVAGDGAALPAFEAGAAIDVLTPAGLRAYSLGNPPSERHRYVILVQREARSRGGSVALHDAVRPGDRLRVRLRPNEFALAAHAVHSLLVAGGIGVAPLAAMAAELWRRGAPFELHYSCRSRERAALHDVLRASAYAQRVQYNWSEAAGRFDVAHLLRRAPWASDIYVCGPAGLIAAAVAAHRATGRDPARLHFERFA